MGESIAYVVEAKLAAASAEASRRRERVRKLGGESMSATTAARSCSRFPDGSDLLPFARFTVEVLITVDAALRLSMNREAVTLGGHGSKVTPVIPTQLPTVAKVCI
jgi:hypothetical protein